MKKEFLKEELEKIEKRHLMEMNEYKNRLSVINSLPDNVDQMPYFIFFPGRHGNGENKCNAWVHFQCSGYSSLDKPGAHNYTVEQALGEIAKYQQMFGSAPVKSKGCVSIYPSWQELGEGEEYKYGSQYYSPHLIVDGDDVYLEAFVLSNTLKLKVRYKLTLPSTNFVSRYGANAKGDAWTGVGEPARWICSIIKQNYAASVGYGGTRKGYFVFFFCDISQLMNFVG